MIEPFDGEDPIQSYSFCNKDDILGGTIMHSNDCIVKIAKQRKKILQRENVLWLSYTRFLCYLLLLLLLLLSAYERRKSKSGRRNFIIKYLERQTMMNELEIIASNVSCTMPDLNAVPARRADLAGLLRQ